MDEHITPHDVVDEDVLENDVALEHPHVCMGGTVYVGHLVENEECETVEVFEAYPCRRCPNFALWGFSEVQVREYGVLRSSPRKQTSPKNLRRIGGTAGAEKHIG
jgi:hypothetical protein